METLVSRDGQRALALQRDNTLYRWDISSGEPVGSPLTFPWTIHRLRMSRDGSVFCGTFGSQPCGLGVWEFATGRQLMLLPSPLGDLFDCELSPDGKWIAAASWEGLARNYDVATGLPTGDAMRHARGVGRSIFSPDGKKFATTSWDNTARLWNPHNGSPASPWLHHAGYVAVAAFSPDSKWLITGGQDESVRVWDLEAASVARHIFRHEGRVTFAAYSADGNRIATAGRNGWVNIWDRSTGALLASNRIAIATSVGRFSPSGRQISIGSTNGTVTVLDGLTCAIVHSFRAHSNVVASVEFSADGTRLLTASTDGGAGIWDSSCGKPVGSAVAPSRCGADRGVQPRWQTRGHRQPGSDRASVGRFDRRTRRPADETRLRCVLGVVQPGWEARGHRAVRHLSIIPRGASLERGDR